ncbi:MAG: OmpP1/FadL family transporter [bacterium]
MFNDRARLTLLLVLGLLTAHVSSTLAQGDQVVLEDNIFTLGMQLGVGTRALGMGGAYSYRHGDYSASFWNPAALTDIKRIEVYGSMSHLIRDNNSQFAGVGTPDQATFTDFNTFGLAYPVPTSRGSLVLSFGYNRVKSVDQNSEFNWFNATPDDSVRQAWRERENGSLNAWILSGGIDVSKNLSVGIGLNFWTGNDDFELAFRERDELDLYTFDQNDVESNINSDITGFNVKLGAFYRLGRVLQLGASIATPTTLRIKETSNRFQNLIFDADSTLSFTDEGFFDYKIRSPFTFSGGGTLNLLNFVFSGEVEYNDWTQTRYTTDPPFQATKTEANRLIEESYRATMRIRGGAEFTLPFTGLSFRVGYFRDPSIFENALSDQDKQFYTAGVGFLLAKQVKLDLAYAYGFWKNRNVARPETNDVTSLVEDVTVNKVFVSLAFRL